MRNKLIKVYCSSLYGCELWDWENRSSTDLCVAWRNGLRRVWRYLRMRTVTCCVWYMIQDAIASRFINFIFECMYCNSTFISSVVWSAFTNMNCPISKNVRLCALKYGIGEGNVGFRGLIRNVLFSACSLLHLWFATGSFCVVEICVRGHCITWGLALAWFVRLWIVEERIFLHYWLYC